jgi:uncharacterized protein YkwD
MRTNDEPELIARMKNEIIKTNWKRKATLTATLCLALTAACPLAAQEDPVLESEPLPQAPPSAPPVVVNPAPPPPPPKSGRSASFGTALYSIGNPTDEEQFYLELINRARANPAAEGQRLRNTTDPEILSAYAAFGVDLNLMVTQMSALAPAPPVSFNAALLTAARLHSGDMFTNNFQGHFGSGGSDPGSRLAAQGYTWAIYGENVYAASRSTPYGHAGFEVDWGVGPGGMQTPAGHRNTIHNASLREVGIGVVNGMNGSVGPQIVTQDFASQFNPTPFITGVVYFDFNGNGFYDLGEGVGGVRVDVSGASYYALTANSGGYSVPVPGNGTYTVTFTATGLPASQQVVTVSGNNNVKVDFVPVYAPPLVSGPNPAQVGAPNPYNFTPVGAALSYQWKQCKRIVYTLVEGAETGTNNVVATLSTNYAVIVSNVKYAGSNSFRLVHPQPMDQFLTLNRMIRPGTNSQLIFASRLGWASTGQVARVQVTTNGGANWVDVYARVGTGTSGQTSFVRTTNSLAPFAGAEVQVRFMYDYVGGSYYNQTSSGIGFYVDDISISNAEELVEPAIADVPSGTGFTFNPSVATNYCLSVRARVGERWLSWGPALLAAASATAPVRVQITSAPVFNNSRVEFLVTVLSGTPDPASFRVESAPSVMGPWTEDTSASFATLVAGVQYRASAAARGAVGFYRVVAR